MINGKPKKNLCRICGKSQVAKNSNKMVNSWEYKKFFYPAPALLRPNTGN
jgi:hypothetical protein